MTTPKRNGRGIPKVSFSSRLYYRKSRGTKSQSCSLDDLAALRCSQVSILAQPLSHQAKDEDVNHHEERTNVIWGLAQTLPNGGRPHSRSTRCTRSDQRPHHCRSGARNQSPPASRNLRVARRGTQLNSTTAGAVPHVDSTGNDGGIPRCPVTRASAPHRTHRTHPGDRTRRDPAQASRRAPAHADRTCWGRQDPSGTAPRAEPE